MLDDEEEFSAASFSKYRNQRAEEMKATHDEDDELRAILAEQKKVKGDSLASTRNALKQVKETEVVGTKTMNKLAQQTEQLSHVEEDINVADQNMETSYKAAKDLHKYDGLIPISLKNIFGGKKKREIDDKLEKDLKQINKEEAKNMKRVEKREGRAVGTTTSKTKLAPTGDEVEDEINENLDEISGVVGNLKQISLNMNDELTYQETQIKRIDTTTTHVDQSINRTTKKLGKWL